MGTGPVYLSLDIDVADPAFAPGTGTPEVRSAAPWQSRNMYRFHVAGRYAFCLVCWVVFIFSTTAIHKKSSNFNSRRPTSVYLNAAEAEPGRGENFEPI